jgi:hypothetical protein
MQSIASSGKYFSEEMGGEIPGSMNQDDAASGAAREIADLIHPKEGVSDQQSDASVALLILMELLDTPRAKVEETAHYFDSATDIHVTKLIAAQAQGAGLLILPFGVEEPTTIQDAIISNWNEEVPIEEGIKDVVGTKHAFHREIKLANPPASLTLSLKRFTYGPDSRGQWGPQKLRTPISGLTGDVRIPVKPLEEGAAELATYTPSSIICHYGGESANSGHYATYRREGENWFILNDSEVERVANLEEPSGYKFKELGIHDHGEEMMSHGEFLECNAYIVSYRRVE